MNKVLMIILIILLSIIALVLTAGFVILLNANQYNINFSMDFAEGEPTLIKSEEANFDSINKIDFEIYSIDLEIKPSENENIKVEYYSNKEDDDKIEMTVEESTLRVKEKQETKVSFGIVGYNNKLVLYVPAEYSGEYNIAVTSGDIRSEIDMSNGKSNIVTTSGDIKLDVIGESNVATTSGDIKINKITENASVATTSGDVWIGESKENLKVGTTSGDLKIDNISGEISLKTTSGDILLGELNIEENSNIKTTSGDVYIKNNASNCYVDTKTTSGDAKVNQSDRKSDIELKIETMSGDISVN